MSDDAPAPGLGDDAPAPGWATMLRHLDSKIFGGVPGAGASSPNGETADGVQQLTTTTDGPNLTQCNNVVKSATFRNRLASFELNIIFAYLVARKHIYRASVARASARNAAYEF